MFLCAHTHKWPIWGYLTASGVTALVICAHVWVSERVTEEVGQALWPILHSVRGNWASVAPDAPRRHMWNQPCATYASIQPSSPHCPMRQLHACPARGDHGIWEKQWSTMTKGWPKARPFTFNRTVFWQNDDVKFKFTPKVMRPLRVVKFKFTPKVTGRPDV